MTARPNARLALGTDVVAISRIKRLLETYSVRFREFAFTDVEQAYCDDQAYPAQHFAGRWAVKEAVIKALSGTDANPDLTSIEVVADPAPSVTLTGDAEALLESEVEKRGVSADTVSIAVSLSHESHADIATGMVIVWYP